MHIYCADGRTLTLWFAPQCNVVSYGQIPLPPMAMQIVSSKNLGGDYQKDKDILVLTHSKLSSLFN